MRHRDVKGFLAELERRLRVDPTEREQIVGEIGEHLDDLVAEATALGADAETAEARAVARFGSPRRLARGLGSRRRTPRGSRLALALGALALSGGFAYAQLLRPAAPVVALSVATTTHPGTHGTSAVTVLGQSRLVALDPVTLRVLKRGPVVFPSHQIVFEWLPPDFAFVSPDGSQVAVVDSATLRFYGLDTLRLQGTTRLGAHPAQGPTRPSQKAGYADRIRTGAWLGDHVVALVQHQAPPYASRVTRRDVVVIDPATRRILSRHPSHLKGAVIDSAHTQSHDVILACANGRASILDVRADGSSSILTRIGLHCAGESSGIGLAVSDSEIALVQAGQPIVLIDVSPQRVRLRHVALSGRPAWSAVRRPFLRAAWWHDRLIVTGAAVIALNGSTPRWPGAGVTSIDPATGAVSVLSVHGSWFVPTPNRLVVGGQGLGLTAFTPSGDEAWHADGTRTVWPYAAGATVFAPRPVKRHTIVDSFSLQSGRQLGSRFQPGPGTRPFSGVIPAVG